MVVNQGLPACDSACCKASLSKDLCTSSSNIIDLFSIELYKFPEDTYGSRNTESTNNCHSEFFSVKFSYNRAVMLI